MVCLIYPYKRWDSQVRIVVYVQIHWGQFGVKTAGFMASSFAPMFIFTQKKNLFKRISLKKVTFSIAGAGFEPDDLRVMSSDCAVLYR